MVCFLAAEGTWGEGTCTVTGNSPALRAAAKRERVWEVSP